MPLNITPAGQSPEKSANPVPAKYAPARQSPGVYGNTAPIPGVEQAPESQEQAADGAPGEEGGHADPDIAFRLGIVARKDLKARQRLEAAKAAEARARALEEQLSAREAAISAEEGRRVEWRRNPKRLLEDHGFVPEAAVQYMLNGERLTPEQQLAASLDQRLDEERRDNEQRIDALRQEQSQREAEREAEDARQQERQLTEQEQIAVQELQADIGEIVAGDPKGFPLVRKAGGRGVAAVQERIRAISDEQYQTTGRRPPITTKLLERATADVESAARKELQEAMADPELAAALGMGPVRMAARPQTLTNRAPPVAQAGNNAQETRAEKDERVKRHLAQLLAGRRG